MSAAVYPNICSYNLKVCRLDLLTKIPNIYTQTNPEKQFSRRQLSAEDGGEVGEYAEGEDPGVGGY